MKEYFLKSGEMKDIPGYREEKQTMVDENQVNEAFEPANDAFFELRETGEWVFEFISDSVTQAVGYFL